VLRGSGVVGFGRVGSGSGRDEREGGFGR
jgi:hypothetical protein